MNTVGILRNLNATDSAQMLCPPEGKDEASELALYLPV